MELSVPQGAALARYDATMIRWPLRLTFAAGLLSLLAACSSTSLDEKGRVPVTDRSSGSATVATPYLPGQENAGKPGYYTVRPGDTLIRIGLDTGQNWRDIARWNGLDNPNLIEVGQVVRVIPPAREAVTPPPVASVAVAPVAPPEARVKPRSLNGKSTESTGAKSAVAKPVSTPAAASQPSASSPDELSFAWPSSGGILDRFDEARNKGLDIGGKAGDPVQAAADGRVVYAGAGLRGYGNLIILKHNNTYLTAYAHNQTLLVKEDQNVRQGQKIAEMGNSDADRVKLHFEVRRQGKPVDPLKYLPSR